jgi:glutamate decarboxylase
MAPLAVGWIVWREKSLIPQGLLLESSYLRGTHSNFSLSFSRSGAPIAGQYYNFLRFGLDGYRERTSHLLEFAYRFSIRLEDTGYFVCLSGAHRQPLAHRAGNRYTFCCGADQAAAPVLPIVVFTLTGHARQQYPKLQLSDVSNAMQDSKLSIPSECLLSAPSEDRFILTPLQITLFLFQDSTGKKSK